MSRRIALLCLLSLAFGSAGAAWAQEGGSAPQLQGPPGTEGKRDPVITMFDNFSISLVAAQRCSPPDNRTMNMFLRNLMIVQQITANHYHKLMPDKSADEITNLMNQRVEKLGALTSDAVQTKGCTDPDVIKLVQSFDVNAHWNPAGK